MAVNLDNILAGVGVGSGHVDNQDFIENFSLVRLPNMAIVELVTAIGTGGILWLKNSFKQKEPGHRLYG